MKLQMTAITKSKGGMVLSIHGAHFLYFISKFPLIYT